MGNFAENLNRTLCPPPPRYDTQIVYPPPTAILGGPLSLLVNGVAYTEETKTTTTTTTTKQKQKRKKEKSLQGERRVRVKY